MPRVIHFQISTDKPEDLTEFYEKVFGWKIRKLEGPVENWLIITGFVLGNGYSFLSGY